MVSPVNSGKVVWSGDNPGIYLQDAQGNWQTLAVYFRVVTSPHGPGSGVILLGAPRIGAGWPLEPNLCICTNEALLRWLVQDFVSRFSSFRDAAGLQAMTYLRATSTHSSAEGQEFHEEVLEAEGATVALRWESLGTPFAADVPPAMSATGQHQMLSVFVEAQSATIRLNDAALPGQVITRDFLGQRMRTSFLAFCEAWIEPPVR